MAVDSQRRLGEEQLSEPFLFGAMLLKPSRRSCQIDPQAQHVAARESKAVLTRQPHPGTHQASSHRRKRPSGTQSQYQLASSSYLPKLTAHSSLVGSAALTTRSKCLPTKVSGGSDEATPRSRCHILLLLGLCIAISDTGPHSRRKLPA